MPYIGQPLFVIEIIDKSLEMLVEAGKAELLHRGDTKFVPFKGDVHIESLRYMKSYDVFVSQGNFLTAQRARIKLFFDRTINRGFVKMSIEDKAALDKAGYQLFTNEIVSEPEPSGAIKTEPVVNPATTR